MGKIYMIQGAMDDFDYGNAASFGEVVTVLPFRNSASLYQEETATLIDEVLAYFDPETDYIMDAVGDRMNGYLVASYLCSQGIYSFNALRWDRKQRSFTPVQISMFDCTD